MAEVKTSGWPEFDATLRELDAALQRKALIEIAGEGADIAVEAIRAAAPRDTGELADSIKRRVSGRDTDVHEATVNVTAGNAFYWLFVEYGTKERLYRHRKGSSGKMPAHPFVRPAIEQSRERITEAMKQKMLAIVERFK